ncbi:sulfatase-like hydrolase/transferase [Cupriavidus oxalaticus]|jgi:choline-sulfatase|uniref:Sulfatase n=1 Tax=Cupriavidus oxalaticus TaxID=96344 RepID=A0A375GQG6_9BURK|nr:sulfatase-like hydrolase/transferase [Cupriavidus oxalaticus]QEZ42894.1 sulfatase [Cupriavidus oxalaticus]QRQ83506.1 sulfatase-like hydrolase/transferase [Cupriavidus oxalaticus]QRQ92405.1 sulfatase-like hydrolase/transferase [Cupriavidus oxalaticus]WQD87022.1 sulfatase-like hydrolase/transferase [Cupriavidus oxalaticus]SPC07597.1 putative sulfatase [Cupriavidus oxalaticus]
MTRTPKNLLIIMSDEHNPKMLGCAGHPIVETPNLDRLAARGTRFRSAYCTSPVCIPARASFAVGKYIHQMGYADNADAYDGVVPSWHHKLRERGHRVVSIGKLHFREEGEDHGFSDEVIPMHIIEGKGDLMGLVRSDLPVRKGAYKMANLAGPGESQYTFYDREITARAQVWLREAAARHDDKPWVLFVSFVAPHFPLTAPPEHFYKYYDRDLPLPKLYARHERPDHPYLVDYRSSFNYDDYFDAAKLKKALAGYYGLCSFLDENIGKVLQALSDAGLADDTRVLYTSDHGDNLGTRGMWGKSTMFEEAAGVPLIMAGPDIPAGKVIDTPASHVDAYPFILEAVGVDEPALRDGFPGVSLNDLAGGEKPSRNVLVEYHGMGSATGAFMIRHKQYKYIYYVDYPPQLFDLAADPEEIRDLAPEPTSAAVLNECHQRLLAICDPVAVDNKVRQRQAELLEANGGRDLVIQRGDLGFSPPPGAAIVFD